MGANSHCDSREHLYRCHKQKPHCTKCGEPFADESGKFLQRFEGFNEEQEAKLKDKKRKRGESNEEKWKDIFKILFPDTVEIPSPYYKSPAHERFQDRTTKTANTKYGFIDDPFESHEPGIESEARSKMEKITGSLPDDVWSEMKEIFRDLAFSGAKAFRTPTAPDTNRHHLKTARTMESQISLCGSSTSSTSHQI
ncbi:hypothetical protein K4K59_004505 [Colletotrichum sp. SAR11_240]|nr:hypothetical protein K4K59_004505 [Colletotrichum sp. SAR11_240]